MAERKGVRATDRFRKKRDAILDASTVLLNQRGVKGLTLADAAAAVGLSTTSVTYYFKRKDDLAAACMMRGIAWLQEAAETAVAEPTPADRLHKLEEELAHIEEEADALTARWQAEKQKLGLAADLKKQLDEGADFAKRYQARFKTEVLTYGPFMYDSMMVVAAAMKKADSTEPAKYLAAIRDVNYEGVTNTFNFDDKGNLKNPGVTAYAYKDGKLNQIPYQ